MRRNSLQFFTSVLLLFFTVSTARAQNGPAGADRLLQRLEATEKNAVPDDIVRDLTALVSAEPNNARVHYAAAKLYERCGLTDLADQEFDRFDKLDPQGSFEVLDRFFAKVVNGNTSGANGDYRYVVGHFPEEPILMVLYAQIAQRKGNIDDADFFLSQALFVTPHQKGIPTAAADLLLQRGTEKQARRALRLVQEDLARDPRNERTLLIAERATQINQRFDQSARNNKNDIAWRFRQWMQTGKWQRPD